MRRRRNFETILLGSLAIAGLIVWLPTQVTAQHYQQSPNGYYRFAQRPSSQARIHDPKTPYPHSPRQSQLGGLSSSQLGGSATVEGSSTPETESDEEPSTTDPGDTTGEMPDLPSTDVGNATDTLGDQPFDSGGSTTPDPGGPSFSPEMFAGVGGGDFAIASSAGGSANGGVGGYIDSAIPRTTFRIRFDAGYGLSDPSRAEFFYPACGCLRLFGNDASARGPVHGVPNIFRTSEGTIRLLTIPDLESRLPQGVPLRDPRTGAFNLNAAGVSPIAGGAENNIDYQEYVPYFEYAPNARTSFFVETPIRAINGRFINNAEGFSDIRTGFKYAFVARPDRFLTFQTKLYIPTGSGNRGLGTSHPSIEPGLLTFRQVSDRTFVFGEVRDWIPIQASDFGGNVLRYGAGVTHNLYQTSRFRIAPVVEFVGWTVLSGQTLDFTQSDITRSAAGDTILNGKYGVRIGIGDYFSGGGASPLNDRHSLYIGYGNAFTGNHWYEDIFRIEYQIFF